MADEKISAPPCNPKLLLLLLTNYGVSLATYTTIKSEILLKPILSFANACLQTGYYTEILYEERANSQKF
jgi:hypothetical protein